MPSTRMGTVCCSATSTRESLSRPSTDTCALVEEKGRSGVCEEKRCGGLDGLAA